MRSTPADVHAAFDERLKPMRGHEKYTLGGTALPAWQFVAGVDLGLTRDCSAVVVLAIPTPAQNKTARVRLAHHKLWKPSPGEKINIADIERHILVLDQEFGLEAVGYDVWQAEHLAQRLEQLSRNRRRTARTVGKFNKPWMRECAPTAANLREQASLVIEGFQDRRFLLYDCPPLRSDLLKLRVEERGSGGGTYWRLVSPRDGEGHGDTFSAFALAVLIGHELSTTRPATAGTGDLAGSMPLERALERDAARFDMYQREHERLAGFDEHRAGFMDAIRNDSELGRDRMRRFR